MPRGCYHLRGQELDVCCLGSEWKVFGSIGYEVLVVVAVVVVVVVVVQSFLAVVWEVEHLDVAAAA